MHTYQHTVSTLLVIILCLSLSGCFGSQTSLSAIRMDRPEVSGQRYNVRIFQGLGQRTKVDLIEDSPSANEDPILDPNVRDGPALSVVAGIGMTIIPRLEFSIIGSSAVDMGSEFKFGVKYQFSGDATEVAKAGNLSQAFSAGVSGYKDDGRKYSYQNEEYWEQESYTYDLAWIWGYRLNKRHLIYGGPFFMKGSLDGEHTFTPQELDQTPESTIISLNSKGEALGLNLAYEFKRLQGLSFTFEYSWMELKWEQSSGTTNNLNFMVGWHF